MPHKAEKHRISFVMCASRKSMSGYTELFEYSDPIRFVNPPDILIPLYLNKNNYRWEAL